MSRPRRAVLFALCIVPLFIVPAHGQDRNRMTVYIPMPSGGTDAQRVYFQQMFNQELIGANYRQVDTKAESMFTLSLSVRDNTDFDPAYPEDMNYNNRLFVNLKLNRSSDGLEMVNLDFGFNNTEEMNQWNLFLLYQALANAYMEDEAPSAAAPAPERDERWRNKWLYLSPGAGMDIGYLLLSGSTGMARGAMLSPAVQIGLELHFLDFLSLELPLIRLGILNNDREWIFEPRFALALKGVWKPGGYMMLEPYAGVEMGWPLYDGEQPIRLAGMGGVQIGFRLGRRTAIILDLGASASFMGEAVLAPGKSGPLVRISMVAGVKFGFLDRPARRAASRRTQEDAAATPAADASGAPAP